MKKNYIAITIGPIYDTIRFASKPASMWLASYMFSYISKRICDEIENRISKNKIVSPSINGDISSGIGLFHDRIIFESENLTDDMDIVQNIFVSIKKEIAELFALEKDKQSKDAHIVKTAPAIEWFQRYLQLHAVAFSSDKSPLIACSPYLDAIELRRAFPVPTAKNPIWTVLDADDNKLVKQIILNLKKDGIKSQSNEKLFQLKSWPLSLEIKSDMDIPDMETIIGMNAEKIRSKEAERLPKKAYSYYAIVQSDGDCFGNYISNETDKLIKDEKSSVKNYSDAARSISEKCLTFCKEASKIVQDYGGVTIYAGGDDLLFIAPLWELPNEEKSSRRNILQLLDEIKSKFCEEAIFGKSGIPTISFGVAIRYYKYPLYEAFDEAYDQLFHKAKENHNSLALSLRKHSGQSAEFVINNFSDNSNDTVCKKIFTMLTENDSDDFLKSTSYKLIQFQHLLIEALKHDEKTVKNVFANIFDSDIHKKYETKLNSVRELFQAMYKNAFASKKDEKDEKNINTSLKSFLHEFDSVLRLIKFFSETGMEEENEIEESGGENAAEN